MNLIEIMGHLGSDPETRYTPSGAKVITFRVGANARKGGKDQTIWWRVSIWGDRYDKMLPYLKKGTAIIVLGEMHKPEIYTDKTGMAQVSVEMTAEIIKFSPFGKPSQEGAATGAATTGYAPNSNYGQENAGNNNAAYAPNPFAANPIDEMIPYAPNPFSDMTEEQSVRGKGVPAYSGQVTDDNIPF
jgi:single-strand DNA-binding protein